MEDATATSLSTTTDARVRSSAERESAFLEVTSNRGDSPTASARARYRLPSRGAPERSARITLTGSSGDTTKLNTLSRSSASFGSRTDARTLRAATVTGSKDADADPPGSTLTRFV